MRDISMGCGVQGEGVSGRQKYWQELDGGSGPHNEVAYGTWGTDIVRCLKGRRRMAEKTGDDEGSVKCICETGSCWETRGTRGVE